MIFILIFIYQSYMQFYFIIYIHVLLQSQFDLSGSVHAHRYINQKMNRFWRDGYNHLMSKYDNRDLTVDEVLRTIPEHLPKDQFRNKLKERRSDKGKV